MATVEKNYVFHFRYKNGVLERGKTEGNVDSRGGVTVAAILSDEETRVGICKCHTNDNFTKHRGFVSASGRAKSKKAILLPGKMELGALKDEAWKLANDKTVMARFK